MQVIDWVQMNYMGFKVYFKKLIKLYRFYVRKSRLNKIGMSQQVVQTINF